MCSHSILLYAVLFIQELYIASLGGIYVLYLVHPYLLLKFQQLKLQLLRGELGHIQLTKFFIFFFKFVNIFCQPYWLSFVAESLFHIMILKFMLSCAS